MKEINLPLSFDFVTRVVSFDAGQVVTSREEGEAIAFIVTRGVFRVYLPFEDGNEITKSFLVPRSAGITPYRANEISETACVCAVTDGSLLVSDLREIEQEAKTNKELSAYIARKLEEHAISKEQHFVDERRLTTRQRYNKLLQELGSHASDIPLYLIASALGVTAVQLSRIRRKIADDRS